MIFLSFCPPSSNIWTLDVDCRASYREIVVLLVSDKNALRSLNNIATASAVQYYSTTVVTTATQNDNIEGEEREIDRETEADTKEIEGNEKLLATYKHTTPTRETNGHVYNVCT